MATSYTLHNASTGNDERFYTLHNASTGNDERLVELKFGGKLLLFCHTF